MIIQKITTQVDDSFTLAYKYFSILSVINNLNLVKRDLQLLAYSVSENKDVSEIKEEFVKKFSTSLPTVGNIISKLYRLKILLKDRRNVRINPVLLLNFTSDLALAITFKYGDKG